MCIFNVEQNKAKIDNTLNKKLCFGRLGKEITVSSVEIEQYEMLMTDLNVFCFFFNENICNELPSLTRVVSGKQK